jgi:hypothetical protein
MRHRTLRFTPVGPATVAAVVGVPERAEPAAVTGRSGAGGAAHHDG